ncbi:hypothetical protein RQP46_008030 [Phenoliferia psychrophenolica]
MATHELPTGEGVQEENRLNELGYEQELVRGISFLGLLGMGAGIVCLPATTYAITVIAFTEGGPASSTVGCYPVASGTYYWSYALSPPSIRRASSFINGYLLCVGLILSVLAAAFPMAQFFATAIVLFHPDYIIPTWVPYVIFIALLAFSLAICSLGTVFLEKWNRVGGVYVLLATVVMFVVPLAMSPSGHSVRYILSQFDPEYSGWGNTSFLVGLLGPAGVLVGFGFLTSLCEEVPNPAATVPRAMLTTQLVGVGTGIVFIFDVIFDYVMGTPGGALALVMVSACAGVFLIVGSLAAAARFLWSFSRDGGLPGSKWLATVHPRLKIPLNSMIFICVADALLACISFGSSVACRKYTKDAPWSLGKFGWIINILSLVFGAFGCILFLFPLTLPVTVITMNWSIAMLGGFTIIGALYYAVYGRKVFRSPGYDDDPTKVPDSIDGASDTKKERASAGVVAVAEGDELEV